MPQSLRPKIKNLLHTGHCEIDATLRHARDVVYWPGMNGHVKELIMACNTCHTYQSKQQPLALQCHELTHRPWERVGVDLFTIKERHYLATVDYMSNFVEVDRLHSTTTAAVRAKLQVHFARYGIPDTLITDNAPQFASAEFARFAKDWNLQHKTSSPHLPASNGMAESAVKTLKKTLIKCADDGTNVYEAMRNLRNTPRPGIGLSPVQLMMSRRTKTILPVATSLLKPSTVPDTTALRRQRQIKQAVTHNRKARDLPHIPEGTTVRLRPTQTGQKQWLRRTVTNRAADRAYDVQTANSTFRRTQVDLRPVPTSGTTRSGRLVKPVQRYGFDYRP